MRTLTPRDSLLAAALTLACGTNTYADAPDFLYSYDDTDGKFYPATFCDSNKPGAISYTQDGKAVNPSTDKAYEVTCPLIRDRTGGTDPNNNYRPTNFDYVHIGVSKKSSQNVTCYVRSRGIWSSNSGYLQTSTITGGVGDYGSSFYDLPAGYNHSTVGCIIPKATGSKASTRSGVTGYWAYEASEYWNEEAY